MRARGQREHDRLLAHRHREHSIQIDIHVALVRIRCSAGSRGREVEVRHHEDDRDRGPVADDRVVRGGQNSQRRGGGLDSRRGEPEDQCHEGAGKDKHQRSHAEDRPFRTQDRALLRVPLEG